MRAGALLILLEIAIAPGTAAAADEQPICADRPSKATSPCTVPAGHLQIETGLADWTLLKAGGERDTSFTIGETTFKYGLTDHSDLELDVTPFVRVTSHAADVHQGASGFGDLIAIYKHELTGGDAPLQLSLYPFVKIPTAGGRIGNRKWEAGLLIPVNYDLPGTQLSINVSPELDWVADQDGHGHHWAMAQVASLGWQANDKLNLSAELWGQWDWDGGGTSRQASLDGAVAYLVNKDVQLDAGANFGLNRNTPDIEFYAGVSTRF